METRDSGQRASRSSKRAESWGRTSGDRKEAAASATAAGLVTSGGDVQVSADTARLSGMGSESAAAGVTARRR